jgi:hypothetical protein
MEDNKDLVIEITDYYGDNLSDGVGNKKRNMKSDESRPKGFVEIFEVSDDGSKKLLGKHNLVVYQGREWLITRAFNY